MTAQSRDWTVGPRVRWSGRGRCRSTASWAMRSSLRSQKQLSSVDWTSKCLPTLYFRISAGYGQPEQRCCAGSVAADASASWPLTTGCGTRPAVRRDPARVRARHRRSGPDSGSPGHLMQGSSPDWRVRARPGCGHRSTTVDPLPARHGTARRARAASGSGRPPCLLLGAGRRGAARCGPSPEAASPWPDGMRLGEGIGSAES